MTAGESAEILSRETLLETARYRVERRRERLPGGRVVSRDIVVHPGAAVLVPLRDDGRIVTLHQHRTAVGRTLLELPAGTVERGEDPVRTAARELEEETGFRASELRRLVEFYPTPGITDERMFVYLATGLHPGRQQLDPGEWLEVRDYSLPELSEKMRRREIEDGKTLVALQMLLCFPELIEEES